MTMTIDANQQRFGHMNFDHMPSYSSQPQFTDPWGPSPSASAAGPARHSGSNALFVNNHEAPANGLPHLNLSGLARHPQHGLKEPSTSNAASMASYGSVPVTSASAGSTLIAGAYGQENLLSVSQDLLSLNRLQHPTSSAAYGDTSYATASPVPAPYAPSPTTYDHLGYAPAPLRGTYALGPEVVDPNRRYSHTNMPQDDRRGFQDALEASHGMLSMSQETPRNIYDVRHGRGSRGSQDSYGFPSTHSSSSSISSAGYGGYHYGGSVDSNISDYSTAGSDLESLSGRTLPPPHGMVGSQIPPAPQSMMGQFSSKVASSAQKKHKCKVCDKRFTRPSSLQTHMYSHTGEKPFGCEVDGCGRRFSVVSNLRRHRKVHKNRGSQHDASSPSETGESEDHPSPASVGSC